MNCLAASFSKPLPNSLVLLVTSSVSSIGHNRKLNIAFNFNFNFQVWYVAYDNRNWEVSRHMIFSPALPGHKLSHLLRDSPLKRDVATLWTAYLQADTFSGKLWELKSNRAIADHCNGLDSRWNDRRGNRPSLIISRKIKTVLSWINKWSAHAQWIVIVTVISRVAVCSVP